MEAAGFSGDATTNTACKAQPGASTGRAVTNLGRGLGIGSWMCGRGARNTSRGCLRGSTGSGGCLRGKLDA
jgi:hypothetical protein